MGYPGNQTDLVSILTNAPATPPYAGRFFNKIVGSVTGNLTVEGSGLHKYVAQDGQLRSEVLSPGNSGILNQTDESITEACEITGVEAALTGGVSDTVTVTRNGEEVTLTDPPTFDGIDITYDPNGEPADNGTLTDIVINNDGAGLEEGDVITFGVTDANNSNVVITFTVREDDLKLSAGYYQFKATTSYVINIGVGEVIEGHFTKITTDGTAKCVAYMN